ncbi:MAG: hypothetical protein RLZZ79_6 [Actinomycetota bacterium]|jgi:hypothetical protein
MAEPATQSRTDASPMIMRQESFNFFQPPMPTQIERGSKLYLVPTTHGEVFDPDFAPEPSPLSDLPEIERWTVTYLITSLEILAKRRPIQQIARSTHRFTYNSISSRIGSIRELPRIRSIHRNQPIEGVIEMTTLLNFKERTRALVMRFEGVDRKWLCTEFELL